MDGITRHTNYDALLGHFVANHKSNYGSNPENNLKNPLEEALRLTTMVIKKRKESESPGK